MLLKENSHDGAVAVSPTEGLVRVLQCLSSPPSSGSSCYVCCSSSSSILCSTGSTTTACSSSAGLSAIERSPASSIGKLSQSSDFPPSSVLLPPSSPTSKTSREVYREYAEHYYERFRAAIDYQFEEKPRQITCGIILLVVLVVLGFYESFSDELSPLRVADFFRSRPSVSTLLPSKKLDSAEESFSARDSSCLGGSQDGGDRVTCRNPFTKGACSSCMAAGSSSSMAADSSMLCSYPPGTALLPVTTASREEGDSLLADDPASSSSGSSDSSRFPHRLHVSSSASHSWCFPWCELLEDTTSFSGLSTAIRRSLLTLLLTLTIYSFLQTRDGLLVRPHPGFWRVVHAVGLLHFLLMCVLLVLSPDAGRTLIGLIFPEVADHRRSVGVHVHGASDGEKVFAGTLEMDCRLNAQTVVRQLKTPWFMAHVIGWLAKMCIFRDWSFCLVYSATFELCELSFQWMVPELKECWWDSVLLDYVFANMVGMLLGVWCLRRLRSYQYDWVGQRPLYKKALLRFLPFTWSEYQWQFFNSPWRLLQSVPVLVLSNVVELNVFFFMYALDIPASHYIHGVRCCYLGALGCAAVAEHYEYINSRGKRIGHNEWLLILIILVECLVSGKYGYSKFGQLLPPPDVWIPWIVSLTWFSLWCFCRFVVLPLDQQQHSSTQPLQGGRIAATRRTCCQVGKPARLLAHKEEDRRHRDHTPARGLMLSPLGETTWCLDSVFHRLGASSPLPSPLPIAALLQSPVAAISRLRRSRRDTPSSAQAYSPDDPQVSDECSRRRRQQPQTEMEEGEEEKKKATVPREKPGEGERPRKREGEELDDPPMMAHITLLQRFARVVLIVPPLLTFSPLLLLTRNYYF